MQRLPAPIAPAIRSNVYFQIEIVPANGHQTAIISERRLRNVAVFWAAPIKPISLTVRQPTILVA
jgi:hypothetical protein